MRELKWYLTALLFKVKLALCSYRLDHFVQLPSIVGMHSSIDFQGHTGTYVRMCIYYLDPKQINSLIGGVMVTANYSVTYFLRH